MLDRLPIATLIALRAQARHLDADLEAAINSRLASGTGQAVSGLAEPDRLLSVEETAKIAGVTRVWLYRHAAQLPFTRRLSPKALRFSSAGLQRWLASRRP